VTGDEVFLYNIIAVTSSCSVESKNKPCLVSHNIWCVRRLYAGPLYKYEGTGHKFCRFHKQGYATSREAKTDSVRVLGNPEG